MKKTKISAKKFLRIINSGMHSTINYYKDKVKYIGDEIDKNYQLTSISGNNIIFEDIDENIYYQGKIYKSNNGSITEIKDITELEIYDENRDKLIKESYSEIIEGIVENDYKKSNKAFDKLKMFKFRSTTIPPMGRVLCRDGEIHKIIITEQFNINTTLLKECFENLINDKIVKNEDGNISKIILTENKEIIDILKNIPTKEIMEAKIAVERERVKRSYKNKKFVNTVFEIARLINEDKLEDAVFKSSEYLSDEQTILLLTESELTDTVEYALSCKGVFNPNIGSHVAEVLYETALNVNKSDTLEFWVNVERKIENDNVKNLIEGFSHDDGNDNYSLLLESAISGLMNMSDIVNVFIQSLLAFLNNVSLDKLVGADDPSIEQAKQDLEGLKEYMENTDSTDRIDDGVIVKLQEIMVPFDILDRHKTMINFDETLQLPVEKEEQPSEGAIGLPTEEESAGAAGLGELGAPEIGGPEGAELGEGTEEETEEEEEGELKIEESAERLQNILEDIKKNKEQKFKEEGFKDNLNKYIAESLDLDMDGLELLQEFSNIRDEVESDLFTDKKEGKNEFPFEDYDSKTEIEEL